MRRLGRARRDDAGVTLVLALVTTVATSVALLGIADLTTGGLVNSRNLRTAHNLEYAADAATTIAVQSVRYSGYAYVTGSGSAPGTNCLPGSTITANSVTMQVFCSGRLYDPFSSISRLVDLYACTSGTCSATNSVLQAEVTFDDLDASSGANNCTPFSASPTVASCGVSQTVNSWVVNTGSN